MLGRKPKSTTLTEALRRETQRITDEKYHAKMKELREIYDAAVAKEPEAIKGHYLIYKAEREKTKAAYDFLCERINAGNK